MTVIQPFGDRVLVCIKNAEQVTEGGLLVAPSNTSSNRGIVEALGDDTDKLKFLNVGDEVFFNTSSGMKYVENLVEYRIISSRDILGKIIKE